MWKRLLLSTIRALLWPDPKWAKYAHSLIFIGIGSFVGASRWDRTQEILRSLGFHELPDGWAYITAGAIFLAVLLAARVASLTTNRIIFGAPRLTRGDKAEFNYDLPISQVEHKTTLCRIKLVLKRLTGEQIKEYSLQTVERVDSGSEHIGRINIDSYPKLVRIFYFDPIDSEFHIPLHEDEAVWVRDSFLMDVVVAGDGIPTSIYSISIVALESSLYVSDGVNGHGHEIVDDWREPRLARDMAAH